MVCPQVDPHLIRGRLTCLWDADHEDFMQFRGQITPGGGAKLSKPTVYLPQIAHIAMQVVEVGSLVRDVATEFGRTPMRLFGSLKNLARRLREAFRFASLSDQGFDPFRAASIQIRLDSSLPRSSAFRVSRYQPRAKKHAPPLATYRARARFRCAIQLPDQARRRLPVRFRPGVFLRAGAGSDRLQSRRSPRMIYH
jgi:hypothetical protein